MRVVRVVFNHTRQAKSCFCVSLCVSPINHQLLPVACALSVLQKSKKRE